MAAAPLVTSLVGVSTAPKAEAEAMIGVRENDNIFAEAIRGC
jgi:hypothetical protein